MGLAFLLLIILAVSYLVLRQICLTAGEWQQSPAGILVIGVITWFFLLSAGSWFILALYLIVDLVANRDLSGITSLVFIGLTTALAFRVNELLDAATVLHYVRDTAFFRPIKSHSMNIHEELDKKMIQDIHRETSDKPFPTAGTKKRLLTDYEIQQYRRGLHAARERKARSIYFDQEIQNLKSGMPTPLADPWKVYTFDHKLHDLYPEMSHLQINPATRTLHFNLNIHDATASALQDPIYLYRLKQDLYHLLQVLNTDPWLDWYSDFFDRFVFICYGIESDSFGRTELYPCLKIDIPRIELFQRDGRFFNAADLHTICTLTFNDGKPLPSELL